MCGVERSGTAGREHCAQRAVDIPSRGFPLQESAGQLNTASEHEAADFTNDSADVFCTDTTLAGTVGRVLHRTNLTHGRGTENLVFVACIPRARTIYVFP